MSALVRGESVLPPGIHHDSNGLLKSGVCGHFVLFRKIRVVGHAGYATVLPDVLA